MNKQKMTDNHPTPEQTGLRGEVEQEVARLREEKLQAERDAAKARKQEYRDVANLDIGRAAVYHESADRLASILSRHPAQPEPEGPDYEAGYQLGYEAGRLALPLSRPAQGDARIAEDDAERLGFIASLIESSFSRHDNVTRDVRYLRGLAKRLQESDPPPDPRDGGLNG